MTVETPETALIRPFPPVFLSFDSGAIARNGDATTPLSHHNQGRGPRSLASLDFSETPGFRLHAPESHPIL